MRIEPSTSEESTGGSSGTEADTASDTDGACPICGGIGYVRLELPVDHPEFGRPVPCECQKALLASQRTTRLQQLSNLGPLSRLTFDNLIENGRSADPNKQERFRRVFAAARAFAANPDGWLILSGVSGCGKTHLAAAIANECIAAGQRVFFTIVPDLLDHLRLAYDPNSAVTYDQLFEEVRNTPLLILDDLGTQKNTAWAEEKLFQIINHRFNAQLPTIITTNCSMDELNERIRTRLTDPTLCQLCVVEGRESEILQKLSNLEFYSSMTFENFDLKRPKLAADQRHSLETAYKIALGYAHHPDGWLIFQGEFGCGKTHLAAAIANERRREDDVVYFVVVADLLDYLRSTYAPESRVTYDELFDSLRNAPLLILDDLGAQVSTAWAREKLFQLINYRYNGRLPTVITTNCSLDQIEGRLSSRMVDPRLSLNFWLNVPDYRADASALDLQAARRTGKREGTKRPGRPGSK